MGTIHTVDAIIILHIFWCISGNSGKCMKEASKDKTNDRLILLISTSEDKYQETDCLRDLKIVVWK